MGMARTLFSDLFLASLTENVQNVCSHIKRKVNSDQSSFLSQLFTIEEVEMALKHMGAIKAPGSDGLPALFFQKYWNIIGQEISKLALNVLNNRRDPKDLNHTLITLIPKTKIPKKISHYRPISLCNIIMKLMTKVIANRLKLVLPGLIIEN